MHRNIVIVALLAFALSVTTYIAWDASSSITSDDHKAHSRGDAPVEKEIAGMSVDRDGSTRVLTLPDVKDFVREFFPELGEDTRDGGFSNREFAVKSKDLPAIDIQVVRRDSDSAIAKVAIERATVDVIGGNDLSLLLTSKTMSRLDALGVARALCRVSHIPSGNIDKWHAAHKAYSSDIEYPITLGVCLQTGEDATAFYSVEIRRTIFPQGGYQVFYGVSLK